MQHLHNMQKLGFALILVVCLVPAVFAITTTSCYDNADAVCKTWASGRLTLSTLGSLVVCSGPGEVNLAGGCPAGKTVKQSFWDYLLCSFKKLRGRHCTTLLLPGVSTDTYSMNSNIGLLFDSTKCEVVLASLKDEQTNSKQEFTRTKGFDAVRELWASFSWNTDKGVSKEKKKNNLYGDSFSSTVLNTYNEVLLTYEKPAQDDCVVGIVIAAQQDAITANDLLTAVFGQSLIQSKYGRQLPIYVFDKAQGELLIVNHIAADYTGSTLPCATPILNGITTPATVVSSCDWEAGCAGYFKEITVNVKEDMWFRESPKRKLKKSTRRVPLTA